MLLSRITRHALLDPVDPDPNHDSWLVRLRKRHPSLREWQKRPAFRRIILGQLADLRAGSCLILSVPCGLKVSGRGNPYRSSGNKLSGYPSVHLSRPARQQLQAAAGPGKSNIITCVGMKPPASRFWLDSAVV